MKFTLKDYQREAVQDALNNLRKARKMWRAETDRTAFSLSAVTGAGKTVMAAAVFEALFHGDDELNFDADPGATVIWFSDDPSLNEQTRFRLMEASDRISHTSLVVVENTFNRPKFEAGKVYFLNTQKLGKNSLLVRGHDQAELEAAAGDLLPDTRPDLRAYTIWDTIQNTIDDPDLNLYLVLDEAHRGMGKTSASSQNDKSTIVQRLINGAGSVKGIPVVWGISATVDRFNKAMEGALGRIKLPDVVVDPTKVQESGLIKDTILLDFPDETGDFDTVLVRRATDKLKESTDTWAEYAKQQDDSSVVIPLMVLQVPNTPNPDDIGRVLDTICAQYPELKTTNFAHVLGDHTPQRFGNRDIPYIEPQRVQDSTWVRVLIAKDAISTGWDCPRAEVMVSFRAATDRTHITQLLGRMVRSPLARRIPGDDRLNTVDCLLPKFDRKTVESVVKALTDGEDGSQATPGRILVKPIEVNPNPTVPKEVWSLFSSLPSQTRPQRGAKPAKRLTALAHELASDGILPEAGKLAHAEMHKAIDAFLSYHGAKVAEMRKSVLTVDGKTVVADLKGKSKSLEEFYEDADMAVIDDAFRRASRIFSPDISRTYVEFLARKTKSPEEDPEEFLEAIVDARVTVAGAGLVSDVQDYFDREADKLAKTWLSEYATNIRALGDDRKETYRQLVEMSADPQDVELVPPTAKFEPTKALQNGVETDIPTWLHHLLCDKDGSYPAELNGWEQRVLDREMKQAGFKFWYRNPQQPGQSSLGIAYIESDQHKVMRPDFIFFAEQDGNPVADLVDPHGLQYADALPKLQGLASYAESHPTAFRRIESVAEANGVLRVLDLKRPEVREAIRTAKDAASVFRSTLASDYN